MLTNIIRGPELDKLKEYSEKNQSLVKEVPKVVDVDTSLEVGKPELRVHINRAKAADLGISVETIASSLRTMVAGEEVTFYQEGDNRYEVRLRVAKEDRNSAEALSRLFIPSSVVGNVQLSNVVILDEGLGPAQIERYNRQRQVTISFVCSLHFWLFRSPIRSSTTWPLSFVWGRLFSSASRVKTRLRQRLLAVVSVEPDRPWMIDF